MTIEWPRLLKLIAAVVVVLAITAAYTDTLPSYWRELGIVLSIFDQGHAVNAGVMKQHAEVVVDATGNVVPSGIAGSVRKQVDLSVGLDRERAALVAKLAGQISEESIDVRFGQPGFKSVPMDSEPTYVMVALRSPGEPDDMNPRGESSTSGGKPERLDDSETYMELHGSSRWVGYHALIRKECDDRASKCTDASPLYTRTLMCHPPAYLAMGINEIEKENGRSVSGPGYYAERSGKVYKVWFDKGGAKEACSNR